MKRLCWAAITEPSSSFRLALNLSGKTDKSEGFDTLFGIFALAGKSKQADKFNSRQAVRRSVITSQYNTNIKTRTPSAPLPQKTVWHKGLKTWAQLHKEESGDM